MSNNNYEYDMLRAEILQYLQNYQTVRNMMYIITATILGFAINEENNLALKTVRYLFVISNTIHPLLFPKKPGNADSQHFTKRQQFIIGNHTIPHFNLSNLIPVNPYPIL